MTKVNEDLTRKVANLARLELSDQEVKTFTSQLENILHYVDMLSEANVSGVEPLYNPLEMEIVLREDEVVESPKDAEGHPKVLSGAPDVLYDGFKVPPIL